MQKIHNVGVVLDLLCNIVHSDVPEDIVLTTVGRLLLASVGVAGDLIGLAVGGLGFVVSFI